MKIGSFVQRTMDETSIYSFTASDGDKDPITFSIDITIGDNILEAGLQELRDIIYYKYGGELVETSYDLQAMIDNFVDEGILDREESYLVDDNESLKNLVFTNERLLTDYPFVSIIQKLIKCPGCLNDSCGQMAHMACPDGCLHDPKFCEECC